MLNIHLDRFFTKTACLLLAVFVFTQVSADRESLELGYCQERSVAFMPVTDRGTGGSALYFPESMMRAYKGCRITDIHVGINAPSGKDSVRVFITRGLDEAPLYEQYYTAERINWNVVTLDTPFELDGGAIYIGYEVTGQYYLMYSNAFIKGEEWIKQDAEGWKPYTDIYSASLYATVTGDNLPRSSVSLGHVTMPAYTVAGEKMHFLGEFINMGADDVDNLTFNYIVDGETAGSETVSVSTTAYRETGAFELSGFSFERSGRHSLSLQLAKVNGNADADTTDNSSRTKEVTSIDEFTPRKILFEVFSTELCTACPGTHEIIASTFKDVTDVIEVGHHAGFYTDGLTIPESTEYEWFYGGGRLYAPAMMFDRTSFADNLPTFYTEASPVIGINSYQLTCTHDEAASIPALAEVSVTPQLGTDSRRLDLTVSGRLLSQVDNADNLRLSAYLTEDSIYTTTQAGASEGFYHRYAVRRSLTPTWGEEVDAESGFTKTYTTEIPEEWNTGTMRAVAFISHYDPEDCRNCEVLNSAEARLTAGGSAGIGISEADGRGIEVRYDGCNVIVSGKCDAVTVYNAAGACLISNTTGSTFTSLEQLPRGTYVVKAVGEGTVKTVKIMR